MSPVERWRERIVQRANSLRPNETAPGDETENVALNGDNVPVGYEANWTKLLSEAEADPEAGKKVDIAATKIAAQELCHLLAPALCQCNDDPLKCHAVRTYMRQAVKVVQALRKSDLLR